MDEPFFNKFQKQDGKAPCGEQIGWRLMTSLADRGLPTLPASADIDEHDVFLSVLRKPIFHAWHRT
jgi:hypothetical protein